MDQVQILVLGPTGAGKTTLAQAIASTLRGAGFSEVDVVDDQAWASHQDRSNELQARLQSLKVKGLGLTIQTVRTRRTK